MPYADNDGVSLYYETTDPAENPAGDADTVALVEGLGYGRWMWRWQRDRLAEEGYRVVVWDNRGTGDSDEPDGPYTVAEMAGDLEAVLDAAGVERAHVVGASMGGMIAQQYALDYDRAESLGLLCTSPGGDGAVPTPEETRARMFGVPEDADEREAIRYKMRPAMTDEFWADNDDLISDIVDWRLEGDASDAGREAQAAAVAGFDASDRLGEIEVPVLVAHGTADRVLPVGNADLLSEALPNARLAVFEDGSHLFFVEQADAVNDKLVEFLRHA
ncbi:alpha/beta hydrolase [Halorussus gelatinilyticus]|uniref:Alpha/beta hydrolase n=1 Tax=Halorussus gelatinilyticus TaxID=2937524 RepID=A0A8U0IFS0_9EURY|nr:alpha/beta hydrolase [Halorussus gelatinilyticus]UPV99133.1 alpha/beta hydrolase [Halorussus gelatinilyticus]